MIRPLGYAMLPLLADACAVGPAFHAPAAPTVQTYAATPPPTVIPAAPGAPAQRLVPGMAVAQRWWTQFGNKQLDALVEEALKANADIAVADAAVRQACQLSGVAVGAQLPALDIGYQPERTRTSKSLSGVLADSNRHVYSLNTALVSVSYPLDLFG